MWTGQPRGWLLLLLVVFCGMSVACAPAGVQDEPNNRIVVTAANEALPAPPVSDDAEPVPATREVESTPAVGSSAGLAPTTTSEGENGRTSERASPVVEIPLAGPVSSRLSELSGLAWYNDLLIMLPQFPDFGTGAGNGFIYALPKKDVIAFLDGEVSHPPEPRPIPFVAPGLKDSIAGFEGYEAIAFSGDDVYVTIEAKEDGGMTGYLAKGAMNLDLPALSLDTSTLATIAPQTNTGNMSEESLFAGNRVIGTIYELNGTGVNTSPVVHLFDPDLRPIGTADFPNVEFRITDVTELDRDGRFWAINYFFPGTGHSSESPGSQGDDENSDRIWLPGEELGRLVEFQFALTGVTLTGAAIQLESLLSDFHNWEGLVRLDDKGFLIVSDRFPDTVLGFVPYPEMD